MEQQENKIQGETRAFNGEGELINNSFIFLNQSTGKYEIRSLKEHLTELGLLDVRTKELDNRMEILSNQINQRLKTIN